MEDSKRNKLHIDSSCCICMEEKAKFVPCGKEEKMLEKEEYIYQDYMTVFVPCGHSVCGGCVKELLKNSNSCPMCREEIKETFQLNEINTD